jgi:hypothetical protein
MCLWHEQKRRCGVSKLTEAERTEFEKWADDLEQDAEGTKWGITLYALWRNNQLLQQILELKEAELDAERQNLSQREGLLNRLRRKK